MVGVKWFPGKFSDALQRHQRNKSLLIVNVTYSPLNQTEDTMLQDTLISSFEFDNIKHIGIRIELDSVGEKIKVFNEKFPGITTPGIIFVGFESDGSSKAYDQLPSICDLSEATAPIFQEYENYKSKFLAENPDFASDNEEIVVEEKTLDERKEEVRAAIAKQRELKAKQEEAENLEKEIKRREDGKNALQMQQKMKELEQLRELEKRRMEKEADARRLRELRELERRDKEERARRKAEAQGTAQPATSTPTPAASIKPQQIASDECRICYQFPDGTRVMKVFKSDVNFREVYDAIKDDSHVQGNYKLFTTFPRVAIEDYTKTLLELCLTPASVLAVVKKEKEPESQIVSQSVGILKNAAMMAFTLICGPLASLFQFFSLLFGFRLENPNEPSESERRIQEQQPKRHPKEHRRGEGGRRIKKEGNIQGLEDEESSSDEGTWNGNSTQQL